MKVLLSLLILSTIMPAMANARPMIYCKFGGKVLSIYNEDKCEEAVMTSSACFTGAAKDVAAMINTGAFNWDEQWIEGAYASGNDKVKYYYVDGPGESRSRELMRRCTDDFFDRSN